MVFIWSVSKEYMLGVLCTKIPVSLSFSVYYINNS